MDKRQAQEIIKETFENPFDKVRFTNFIKDLLNRIDESKAFHVHGYVKEEFRGVIKTYERIGTYNSADDKKIDIIVVYLQKGFSLDHARVTQRNFAGRYLADRDNKHAGLFAFVSPEESDWRFSLVTIDYEIVQSKAGNWKGQEKFSQARRWSFLVGENEKSHTAQSRLVKMLANDEQDPTLVEIEKAFDIETVTKEFFLKYRELFLHTKEELDKVVKKDPKIKADFETKGVDAVNFAKKLLGQIIFLYFLQKKGWFGVGRDDDWDTGSKHFLRELFEKKHSDYNNFFNDILEPLFYDALRNDRSHDDGYYSRFNCKIPFLNGGLFDPIGNYDWVHTDILIPDKLFSNNVKTKENDKGTGILDVFDRYNFTVKEDEPLEKEVAIDPELLGKSYEKFNAIRPDNFAEFKKALKSGKKGEENKFNKKFGVYYTPREIVHYMCQQSLINYLHTDSHSRSTSRHSRSVSRHSSSTSRHSRESGNPVVSKEDIEALIHTGEQFSENEARVLRKGKETKTYSHQLPESIRNNAALLDDKLAEITVCDPAVGSGAFPVGMMSEIVKIRNVLTPFLSLRGAQATKQSQFDDNRSVYNFKRQCIEHSLYGVDIDPGAVEIAKLRLWLSLVVDEQDIKNIKPLPNLDYKIVCGNSLLGVEKDLFNLNLFNELEKQKPLFFNETNPTKKQEYKKQIDKLISEITSGHKEFDFEVYFSEVFHQKGGFDVVIANPPYGAELTKKEISSLDQRFARNKSLVKNSAIYFTYEAIELLRYNGVHTYIVPKSLCYSMGWNKCASIVLLGLQKLIDTGKAFEEVKLEQVIFVRVNGDQYSDYVNGLYYEYKIREFAKVSKDIFKNSNVLLTGQTLEELNLIYRIIENFSSKWIDYVSIERGLNWQSKAKKKRGTLPIYRGAQLSKYFLGKPTDYINISQFKRNKYNYQLKPKILNQLAIAHVQNPYPHFYLQASLDLENKLVFETISCTFVKNNAVSIKFLLAINNSKLFTWLLYKFVYSNAIRSTRYDEQYIGKVPCPNFEKMNQKPIIQLVDHILVITKDEDYMQNPQKQAKVKAIEKEIDQLVYKLYDLTPEEIKIVESAK